MYYHADLVINYDGVRQFIFNFFFLFNTQLDGFKSN